jgi:hypothetical protein
MTANAVARNDPPPSAYAASPTCQTPDPTLPVCYAGFQELSPNAQGIDGYVRVSGTVSTTAPHFSFIAVLDSTAGQWLEQGEMQGNWLGGNSPDRVVMFLETQDQCYEYYSKNYAVPPTANYAFYTSYNRQGVHSYTCSNGHLVNTYTWDIKRGSFTNPTFFLTREMGFTNPASIRAYTERQGTAPIGTDRLGCDHNRICGADAGFGLHLYQAGAWNAWTTGSEQENRPPYAHPYVTSWAVATCLPNC